MLVASRRLSFALAALALVSTTGCNNYLKRLDSGDDAKGKKALVVEMKTRFGEASDNLLTAALNVGTSGVLEEVGTEALPKIQTLLAELGYVSELDEEKGKELRDETFLGEGVPAVLSGMWVHPSTAYLSDYNTLVGRSFRVLPSNVAEQAGKDTRFTHFVFATVEFWDDSVLGVARWPRAIVRIAVIDDEGEFVLDASSEGSGPTGVFFPPRSKDALMAAIDDALVEMKGLTPEAL